MLRYLEDPESAPAYMHCEQGVGGTGVTTGYYRIAFNGCTAAEAIDEVMRFSDRIPRQIGFIEDFARLYSDDVRMWGRDFGA